MEVKNTSSSTSNSRVTLFLALVLSFAVNFDSSVVIPIIANYAVSLGATYFFAGIVVGVYSIVHIPSNVIFGRLVDRFGRRLPLIIGLCIDGLSLFLYSLAYDPTTLLLARMIHGIGGGFGGPATMSYLADVTPKERSGRGMAFYGISIAFSMLFGFMIGGIASYVVGPSRLFVGVSLFLFVMAIFAILLPQRYTPIEQKLPLRDEIRIFKETVLRKIMIVPYSSIFALNFNLAIITTTYAIALKTAGYTDATIGMLFGVMVIFSILTHYPAGLLGDKIGKERILVVGLGIIAISFMIIIYSLTLTYTLIAMVILGFGHGMIFPTAAGLIKDLTREANRGIATGVFYGLVVAGFAVGAPVIGWIAQLAGLSMSLFAGILVSLFVSVIILICKK